MQCTSAKIFEFIWNLYITIRGEDSSYSNDLVQSYHLLLGICDLAFKNAFMTERRDLLNTQFSGKIFVFRCKVGTEFSRQLFWKRENKKKGGRVVVVLLVTIH